MDLLIDFSLTRSTGDPLIHHGRHFGRTVHALCNVQALLTNGLLRIGELAGEPEESFTHECVNSYMICDCTSPHPSTRHRQRREHRVFETLLQIVPGLEDRLLAGDEEGVVHIAEMVGPLPHTFDLAYI
jgi:hypothetical protein